jgi:hypothetical protein
VKKYILAPCLILFIFGVSLLYAPPTGWRNEVLLTDDVGTSHPYGHCCVATDDSGRIHVALRKIEYGEERCYDLDYYRSLDTGMTWTYEELISGGTGEVSYRSIDITTLGDSVMIIFQKNFPIQFVKSEDAGETWPSSDQIASGWHPRIAVDGGYLHAMYAKKLYGVSNYEIYHRSSADGGDNWSSADTLTDAIRNSWHPAVSVNAGAIHLVWADNRNAITNYEIYYEKSTNHGTSWVHHATYGLQLTEDDDESEFPDIVAYTDPNYSAVHVVWMDAREDSPGIWYLRSTNNGSYWQDPVRLLADGHHPAIAADSHGLFVVCEKNSYINYLESTNWGTSWLAPVRITNTSDADSFPDITADDLGRHIVFVRMNVGSADAKIWYKQRDIAAPEAPQHLRPDSSKPLPPPVYLIWDANTDLDIWGYKIYKKVLPSGLWQPIAHTTDTTYTDIYVQPRNWYAYYITARDSVGNYSPPSNTIEVYVRDPSKMVNLGTPEPSSYTIERDGYYQWGTSPDSTADFGYYLKYGLTDFVPEYNYAIGFMLFEPACDSGRVISIPGFIENFALPESAQCVCFEIPKPLYSQGFLNIIIPGINWEAVISQILIWEKP